MDFNKLMENKTVFAALIGGVVLVIVVAILAVAISKGGNTQEKSTAVDVSSEPLKEDVELLTTDNLGKALEIQSLLARHNIVASRKVDGTKSVLYLKKGDCTPGMKKCTTEKREQAIMAIVESGLYDQNVGLEIFDKGDFTSTKEDKKIRLTRAMNGELARLIKRIDGISNASVFISIPEQSMFASTQKPITATVQLTVDVGRKLDTRVIKAVTNLLLGSVSGLKADNVSITDTNGHVYSSIMNAESEMLERMEQNDKYMQEKVMAQLNRLVGSGKYVATVSTFLKQAPVEKFTIDYDPNRKTAVNQQVFSEGLGDQTQDINKNTNAVSVYLPNGLPAGSSDSSQNRSYSRTATETQYGVTKSQINEYMSPGMLEEISIAVTLEKDALPTDLTLQELKELVAAAASPKASPNNVTIAFAESLDPFLTADKGNKAPIEPKTGNPWWLAIALIAVGLFAGHRMLSNRLNAAKSEQEHAMNEIKAKEAQQDKQLKDVSMQAAELIEKQSQLAQGLIEQQNRSYNYTTPPALVDALRDLRKEFESVDEIEAGEKIRSWIEQG